MDEDLEEGGEEQDQPAISLVVGILATIVFIILDVVSLIPGVGDIEDIPGVLVFIVSFVSGVGGTILSTQAIVVVIKLFPILQALPAWTLGWLFIWYSTNHPKSLVATGVKLAAVSQLKSNVGNLERQSTGIVENVDGSVTAPTSTGSQKYTGSAAAEKTAEKRDLERLRDKRSDALDTLQGTGQDQDETDEQGQENTTPNQQQNNPADLTPNEERNPIDVAGEELNNPSGNFESWDSNDGKNSDSSDNKNSG